MWGIHHLYCSRETYIASLTWAFIVVALILQHRKINKGMYVHTKQHHMLYIIHVLRFLWTLWTLGSLITWPVHEKITIKLYSTQSTNLWNSSEHWGQLDTCSLNGYSNSGPRHIVHVIPRLRHIYNINHYITITWFIQITSKNVFICNPLIFMWPGLQQSTIWVQKITDFFIFILWQQNLHHYCRI